MRIGLLITLGLSWLLVGGTCLPLVDNTQREPVQGRVLGITIMQPNEDATVRGGATVSIEWAASNLSSEAATITIVAESRRDLSVTTLVNAEELSGIGDSDVIPWDTTGFDGPYAIIGRIDTASDSVSDTSRGIVTIDAPPVFTFTAPTSSVVFRPDTDGRLTIAWVGSDGEATARIGLDPDTDHVNGNEIYIHEAELPLTPIAGRLRWNGTNEGGVDVALGTYNLFASANDGVNEVVFVDAPGQITLAD